MSLRLFAPFVTTDALARASQNFSKKVLETGESDVIILDELLGLIDLGILTEDDVEDLLRIQGDYRKLIITGTKLPEQIRAYVDEVSEIL